MLGTCAPGRPARFPCAAFRKPQRKPKPSADALAPDQRGVVELELSMLERSLRIRYRRVDAGEHHRLHVGEVLDGFRRAGSRVRCRPSPSLRFHRLRDEVAHAVGARISGAVPWFRPRIPISSVPAPCSVAIVLPCRSSITPFLMREQDLDALVLKFKKTESKIRACSGFVALPWGGYRAR
jgi:hypothetical protein